MIFSILYFWTIDYLICVITEDSRGKLVSNMICARTLWLWCHTCVRLSLRENPFVSFAGTDGLIEDNGTKPHWQWGQRYDQRGRRWRVGWTRLPGVPQFRAKDDQESRESRKWTARNVQKVGAHFFTTLLTLTILSNAIRFDPDCEGFVSLEELRFVLANLPVKISHQELEEMMKAADPDGDGKLSLEEFRTLLGM